MISSLKNKLRAYASLLLKIFLTFISLSVYLFLIVSLLGTFEPNFKEHLKEMSLLSFDSQTSYTSGDKNTDIILNYFSGKSDLPFDFKLMILRLDSINFIQKELRYGATIQREKFLLEKLKFFKEIDNINFYLYLIESGVFVQDQFVFVPDDIDRDLLYHSIWKLYFFSGSPKITFDLEQKNVFMSKFGVDAFYNPLENRIYFKDIFFNVFEKRYWSTDVFIDELSHASQFKIAPMRSISKGTIGIIRTIFRNKKENFLFSIELTFSGIFTDYEIRHSKKTLNETYQREYFIPRSLEYESHNEIKYILQTEYEIIVDGDGFGY